MAATLLSATLAVGDALPGLEFEDIDGHKGTSEQFRDWLVVVTFADRGSSDALMEWRDRTNVVLTKKYPGVKVANINFADVSEVPSFMRGVVNPILRSINNRATKRMKDTMDKEKIAVDASKQQFFLVPDWGAKYLKRLGLENAAQYRAWLVKDGRVVAAFTQGEPDVETRFTAAFEQFAAPVTAK